MQSWLRGIFDIFFPPRCEVCREFAPAPLCESCLESIVPIKPPVCKLCGLPLDPMATGGQLCRDCQQIKRPAITWARSAGFYEGALRKAILQMKFMGKRSLGLPLANLMTEAAHAWLDGNISEITIACPVPLHPSRLKERGFNQSELIARYFCEQVGLTLEPSLMLRTKPTIPQVALPRTERDKNIRGAFALSDNADIKDANILLIDDIYTTGATLKECARTLRRGGAKEVYVLTLARPRPDWMADSAV